MKSRLWRDLRSLAVAAALALTAAAPAAAFPVFFNGVGGNGVSATTASLAEGAGFDQFTAPIYPADHFGISIPDREVLEFHISTNPSVTHPTTARSEWTVTNGGQADLDDAWLVFLRPVTYTASKVGINLQPGWALVQASEAGTDYFYPAVFLGHIGASDSTTFELNHGVGEPLTQDGTTFILPQYSLGMVTGVPVPEGSELMLVAAALAFVGALRRGQV